MYYWCPSLKIINSVYLTTPLDTEEMIRKFLELERPSRRKYIHFRCFSPRIQTFISYSKVLSSVSQAFQHSAGNGPFIALSRDGLSLLCFEALAQRTRGSNELIRLESTGSCLKEVSEALSVNVVPCVLYDWLVSNEGLLFFRSFLISTGYRA